MTCSCAPLAPLFLTLGLGCAQVYPEKGTVSFSAGLHGWAFTLTVFANLYAKKFGVEVSSSLEQEEIFQYRTKWTVCSHVCGSATLLGMSG